jgi:hypothetical protein
MIFPNTKAGTQSGRNKKGQKETERHISLRSIESSEL